MQHEIKYKKELARILTDIRKDADMHMFLIDLLTESEYKELATRWQIVKRLARHIPQREIAEELEIGIATVTRGSKEFHQKKSGFVQIIKKYIPTLFSYET